MECSGTYISGLFHLKYIYLLAAVLAVRRLFIYYRLSVEALLMDGHLQDAGLLLQAWPRLAAAA